MPCSSGAHSFAADELGNCRRYAGVGGQEVSPRFTVQDYMPIVQKIGGGERRWSEL